DKLFLMLVDARERVTGFDDIGNVGARAEPALDISVSVAHGDGARQKPVILAVGAAKAQLIFVARAGSERFSPGLPGMFAIVGVKEILPASSGLIGRAAREFDAALIVVIIAAVPSH